MKLVGLGFILMLYSVSVYCQNTMLRVYNNQNQTLAGIYVASKDTILQTDANGACLWKHSFKIPQTLRFYAPDYDTLEFRVTDTLPSIYAFTLAPKGNA